MEIVQLQCVILCKIAVGKLREGKDDGEGRHICRMPGLANVTACSAKLLWKSQCCDVNLLLVSFVWLSSLHQLTKEKYSPVCEVPAGRGSGRAGCSAVA